MKETDTGIKFSEQEPKYDVECTAHGVIQLGVSLDMARIEADAHREEMGCYYPIEVHKV